MIRSKSFIAIPPGATIKEQLNDRKMSQKEFAARMNMSEKHISKLINGEVKLTSDVSNRLEMVLGLPSRFWNNLESIYRDALTKVKIENEMESDIIISKRFPYNEMAKSQWVPSTRKSEERVVALRKFFEVVKLSLLNNELLPKIACRRQAITEKADYALIAWAQEAKIESREMHTSPINIKLLKQSINEIRSMTLIEPSVFCPKLTKLLSKCGIAIVFLPHIGGSFLHGATFYDNDKIIVGLTVRGKDADRFWFSLFHELGHIILGHIDKSNGTTDADETEADLFSKEILIPKEEFNNFVKRNDYTADSICRFAKRIKIDPGIVVGRLQKEKVIEFSWHNNLKTKYSIS